MLHAMPRRTGVAASPKSGSGCNATRLPRLMAEKLPSPPLVCGNVAPRSALDCAPLEAPFQAAVNGKANLRISDDGLWSLPCMRAASHTACAMTGALRGLLNLPIDEEVGLVGLHWGDQFYEFVPWKGDVRWEVAPWGSWKVAASNETHRVLVEATCDQPGTPLRAPTADNGLSPLCKDSFFGKARPWSFKAPADLVGALSGH